MDTKLKNTIQDKIVQGGETEEINWFKRHGLKVVAVFLSVVFLTAGIMLIALTARSGLQSFSMGDCLGEGDYLKSSVLRDDFLETASGLRTQAEGKSWEEWIKNASWLENALEEYKLSLLSEDRNRFGLWEDELSAADQSEDDAAVSGETGAVLEKTVIDVINSEAFLERHKTEIEEYKRNHINTKMNSYYDRITVVADMEKTMGLQWLIDNGGQTQTGGGKVTEEGLKKHRVWGEIENDRISGSIDPELNYAGNEISGVETSNTHIVFAFDDDKIAAQEAAYTADHKKATAALQIFSLFALIGIVLLAVACVKAGRVPGKASIALSPLDRVYWDLHLVIAICLMSLTVSGAVVVIAMKLPAALGILLIALSVLISEVFILSFVRIVKAGKFTDRCGTVAFCKKCWAWCKKIGNRIAGYYRRVMAGRPVVLKLMGMAFVCIIIGILVLALPFVGILLALLMLWYVGNKARNLDQTVKGVQKIYGGDTDYQIEVQGEGAVETMARQINSINTGMAVAVQEAVEKEIKSERLKTELITNVSHDIRTPLTSIITYIDLLKQADIDEESRVRYIEILEKKSARLKALTDDLFEAAKASTGNIEVHMSAVNLESLVNQGMGELEDKIEASDLTFVVNRPDQKVIVNADGRLLWRVIENLLSNVLKYAMPGSRVYMTIDKDPFGDRGVFIMKNVSADPLNLPAEELMERFKRGDDSRHNEGSGLGLSIARDLTVLQGGQFELEIDGDLFKATVYLSIFDNGMDKA